MELDELIERIEDGSYDPYVSGDVVEFYCAPEDYGVDPAPRRAADVVDTGVTNPTDGSRLDAAEAAFLDCSTVERAMRAGWILANPVPTPIRERDGEVVPRTKPVFDHVTNYRKRRRLDQRADVDPDATVWEIDTRWLIDVPEGYSVLYTHPLNDDDGAFTALPGVIDADQFPYWLKVPVRINVDHGNVPFGDPLAQVVPFERSSTPIEASVGLLEDERASAGR